MSSLTSDNDTSASSSPGSTCPDPLWDPSLTWYTSNPDLTECFRFTILASIPVLVLLLHLPGYIIDSRRRWHNRSLFADERAAGGIAHWIRTILSLLVAISSMAKSLSDTDFGADVFFSDAFLVSCVTFGSCLTTWPAQMDRHLLRHTSPMLFTYWVSMLLTSLPTLKVDLETLGEQGGFQHSLKLFSMLTFWPAVVIQIILHCLAEQPPPWGSPQERASFPSQIVFGWLDSIIHKGFKSTLNQHSLPRNPASLHCDMNAREFSNVWEDYRTPGRNVSIWRVLAKIHMWSMVWSFFFYLVHTLLGFVNPQILRLIIIHVQSPDEETWKGVLYAVVLLVSSSAYSLTFQHSIHLLTITANQVRSSLVTAIYRKSLNLSPDSRRGHSSGEIVNFVSVDCQELLDSVPYLSHLWADPLTVILVIAFLYVELGASALGGVCFLLLLVIVNMLGGKKMEDYQEKILKTKDERMKLTNETLAGMLVIKLSAWENAFAKRIRSLRESEVGLLRKMAKLFALSTSTFSNAPVFVSLIVFAIYVATDPVTHILTPEKIFVSIALFSLMRVPLELYPIVIFDTIRMCISLKRVEKFLNSEELDASAVCDNTLDANNVVEIDGGSFSWTKDDGKNEDGSISGSVLENINLDIRRGSLVAVVGRVGSGKSTLLSAILGEAVKRHGIVRVEGAISYVPQQAWVLNSTVKENVVFGLGERTNYYKRVLSACGLDEDLRLLPEGDDTEIGEEGVTLSGGQKQRVSLARATFADRDLYLLDDPLSALDAHVGKHVFENLLSNKKGLLRGKTRILITHSINYLDRMDKVVVVHEGRIAEQGPYEELLSKPDGLLTELMKDFGKEQEADDVAKSEDLIVEANQRKRKHLLSQTSHTSAVSQDEADVDQVLVVDGSSEEHNETSRRGLIQDEEVKEGKVRWSVFLDYMKVIGRCYSVWILVFFGIGQFFHVASTAWLSAWSDENGRNGKENIQPLFYLSVFASIGVTESIISYTRQVFLYLGCAKASRILHHRLLHHVLRSPMSFFDTTPVGRIANRLSSDLDVADESLPQEITDFLWCAVELISTVILISYVMPPFIGVIAFLAIIFCLIIYYYIGSSRQLKRLESVSRSPILSHFQETLSGVSSLRAYGHQERFINTLEDKLDTNVRCSYLGQAIRFWLGTRTEALASLLIFSTALLATVVSREKISGGLAGLTVTYALEVMEGLTWMVFMACNLETNTVCLERIMEYWKLPQEAQWSSGGDECQVGSGDHQVSRFPIRNGQVTFDRFSVRYRDDLDVALDNISFEVSPGHKVGICGRTGAGKSSIAKSLFRIMEGASGRIQIDGDDISTLGLHSLRNALTVIPQDPTLFSGSVRFNLDPRSQHSDSDLWEALEKADLKSHIQSLPFGLDYEVQEKGSNFSVGQRQLVCLARALLKHSKVVVLDEATGSVDPETDSLMQTTVRKKFSESTVLIVAHRLETILDCDEVIVMGEGRVVEMGSPDDLLADPASAFRAMAVAAGVGVAPFGGAKHKRKVL